MSIFIIEVAQEVTNMDLNIYFVIADGYTIVAGGNLA